MYLERAHPAFLTTLVVLVLPEAEGLKQRNQWTRFYFVALTSYITKEVGIILTFS